MTRNERILLNRMRRIAALLALIILLMSSWIKNLYDDVDWIRYENSAYFHDKINKENHIKFLNQKVLQKGHRYKEGKCRHQQPDTR